MNQELNKFLVQAKKSTYAAAKGDSKKILPDGSKEFTFADGDYFYRDRYFGSNPFSGQEVVFFKDKVVWAMNYYGSILDRTLNEKEVYEFLKKALLNVLENEPYRGPREFSSGDLRYSVNIETRDNVFIGHEAIYLENKKVYELFFHGGYVS